MSEENLVLGGRYTLGRMLGHGGMAEVHLAEDTRLHRTVAVKVLRSDLARDDSFQERFRREAQSAASLNHPSIVAVYDTGEEHTTSSTGVEVTIPYIVMEYVHGTTLREHIDPENPMDAARAGEIMAALLSALEYSHRAGIVHRDIKPGNVMLTEAGAVKVMDFGIARAVADATSAMTATQAVMGTAQYLSPEQARGQLVDARSDIYSAACVMYELLTGRPPFTGDTPVSIAYQHVREDPVAPSALNPAITPDLDAVILTGLAKDREERYPSAVAFSRDIAAVVAGRAPRLVGGTVPVGADTGVTTVLGTADDATEALPAYQATTAQPAAVGAAAGAGAASASSPAPAGPRAAEEVSEPEHRRPWWLIVLVILAALGLIAALVWWWSPWTSDEPDTVAVPTLAGETEDSAGALLEEAGLTGTYEQAPSTEVDEGLVISSDPGAGEEVDAGSSVTVTVSSGPDAVTIPDGLVGMSEDDARAALEEVGLEMEVAGTEDQRDTAAETVTRTSPSSGASASPGDTVQVWTATGSYPVPDVTGQTEEDATSTLEDAGFEVSSTPVEVDGGTPGTVSAQSPGPNQSTRIGSNVTISVISEPGPATVPNVVGRTQADAEQVLQEDGFGTTTTDAASDSVPEGSVIRTDPEAGAEVDPQATITLVISRGPESSPTPTPTPTPTPSPTDEPTSDSPSPTTPPEDASGPGAGNGNGNGNAVGGADAAGGQDG